jgi:hypothetical protein
VGKQKLKNQLSETDIRAIYGQGEEAVVSLVSQLMARLSQLEAEVKELKGRLRKNSGNSSKPPLEMALGNARGAYGANVRSPLGGQTDHPGQTLEWCSVPDFVELHAVDSCSGCGHSLVSVPLDALVDLFSANALSLLPQPE